MAWVAGCTRLLAWCALVAQERSLCSLIGFAPGREGASMVGQVEGTTIGCKFDRSGLVRRIRKRGKKRIMEREEEKGESVLRYFLFSNFQNLNL